MTRRVHNRFGDVLSISPYDDNDDWTVVCESCGLVCTVTCDFQAAIVAATHVCPSFAWEVPEIANLLPADILAELTEANEEYRD